MSSSNSADSLVAVLSQLLPGLLVVGLLVLGLGCRKKFRSELQTPLLPEPTVEHRVDAAMREAVAGFTRCPGCAFENFKRFSHCSLCGEKLPTARTSLGSNSVVRSSYWRQGGGATAVSMSIEKPLTPLQVRVRRRKEWVRKLDVDGNMFWFRSATEQQLLRDSAHARTLEQGYVAVFRKPRPVPAPDSVPGSVPARTDLNRAGVSYQDASIATVVAAERGHRVAHSNEAVEMEILTAAQANPALSSTGCRLEVPSRGRLEQVVRLVGEDFPTKYAHFVTESAALLVPAEVAYLELSMHRDFLLEQSVDHVSCIADKHLHSYMRIRFLDESGVDAGGVHREWFMLVGEMLAHPELRLFVCTNQSDQTYYVNPNSAEEVGSEHLTYYFAAGRLVGRALLEGQMLGFHLALPLLKIVLGVPVTFSDLEYLDPEAYRSMVWLRENDNVESLGLDFSITNKRGDDTVVTVDLVPNGRDIPVTDANKHAYLERRFQYLVFESVSTQLHVFLKGVYEVIPQELLMLFDPEEFDFLLCGTQEIDVDDWRTHTMVSSNLLLPKTMAWFWEVVREMPNEYRRRLLQFATGSSRVPLSGFAGLTSYDGRLCPFSLKGVPYSVSGSGQYISSHACFNRLDLPLFRSKRELRTMLYATLETDLYGFTTD